MNSQLIVIVQVLIAVTFILWILSRRGSSPKPTVLNMRADMKDETVPKSKLKAPAVSVLREDVETPVKVLNVIFMWNGHGWDAYEVFGLPGGASISDVRKRYQELVANSDEGQRQFLQAALHAIENKTAS